MSHIGSCDWRTEENFIRYRSSDNLSNAKHDWLNSSSKKLLAVILYDIYREHIKYHLEIGTLQYSKHLTAKLDT